MSIAYYGATNIVELLVGSKAEISKKKQKILNDKHENFTALNFAEQNGFYDIVLLLTFSEMGLSESENIKEKMELIDSQDATIAHYKQNNEIFNNKTITNGLMKYIINCIQNALPFSDDLLNILWHCVCDCSETSELYKILMFVIFLLFVCFFFVP